MDVSDTRLVVVCLAAICVVCLVGIIYLSAIGREPPVALASTTGAAVGTLVGIFIPTRSGK